jgi:hypothetical protein
LSSATGGIPRRYRIGWKFDFGRVSSANSTTTPALLDKGLNPVLRFQIPPAVGGMIVSPSRAQAHAAVLAVLLWLNL